MIFNSFLNDGLCAVLLFNLNSEFELIIKIISESFDLKSILKRGLLLSPFFN